MFEGGKNEKFKKKYLSHAGLMHTHFPDQKLKKHTQLAQQHAKFTTWHPKNHKLKKFQNLDNLVLCFQHIFAKLAKLGCQVQKCINLSTKLDNLDKTKSAKLAKVVCLSANCLQIGRGAKTGFFNPARTLCTPRPLSHISPHASKPLAMRRNKISLRLTNSVLYTFVYTLERSFFSRHLGWRKEEKTRNKIH